MGKLPTSTLLFLLALGSSARADGHPPGSSEELRLIESTERGEDPLGLDESTGQGLDEAARALEARRRAAVIPTPTRGEVLSALEAVSEAKHDVSIELDQGLAFVEVHATFASRLAQASEVAYRLALPDDAVITRVAACRGAKACSEASPAPGNAAGEGPFVSARVVRDGRGRALSLLLSSASLRAPLELYVSYVAGAPVRGGRARFVLPARGNDGRCARTSVHVSSRYPAELSTPAELEVDAFLPLRVSAKLKPSAHVLRESARAACGKQRCTRQFLAAPSAPLSTRPVWLLIDASPSMEGPARGRVDLVLAALLATLPAETQVRAFAFARKAREIGRYRADSAPLATLSDAQLSELGTATRPASIAALASDLERVRPRIVVLSDGQLDAAPREQRALEGLKRKGAELWLLSLGEVRPQGSTPFVGSGGVLELSAIADAARHDDDLEALGEALSGLASPLREHGLRAGEQHVVEAGTASSTPHAPHTPWLAFWAARHLPDPSWSSTEAARDPSAVSVAAYTDGPAPAVRSDTGMPAESVLNMLRTQLVPRARACLRDDRRGRGDYAVALTFRALFAQREIADTAIEGKLDEALRTCLEQALDDLRIPAFSGRVRVRYPIHTEREPPPPVIELEPDLAERVDRVIKAH